jgi:uncharacterized membrane protein
MQSEVATAFAGSFFSDKPSKFSKLGRFRVCTQTSFCTEISIRTSCAEFQCYTAILRTILQPSHPIFSHLQTLAIMKSTSQFLRTTLTGGILFLLPVVLLTMIFSKAHEATMKIIKPLDEVLPETILGFHGSRLVAILLLILVCFVSGIMFSLPRVKKWVSKLEDDVLSYMPGYTLLKSIAADAVGGEVENTMKPVLVKDEDAWNIGFLVEEGEGLCTVFFPEAPKHDSGEVKIVPATSVKKIDVPANKLSLSLKNYGKGALPWVKQHQN